MQLKDMKLYHILAAISVGLAFGTLARFLFTDLPIVGLR